LPEPCALKGGNFYSKISNNITPRVYVRTFLFSIYSNTIHQQYTHTYTSKLLTTHTYLYICIYTHTLLFIKTLIDIYTHTNTNTLIHTWTINHQNFQSVTQHTYTNTTIYIDIHIYGRVCVCMYVWVYIWLCLYIYIGCVTPWKIWRSIVHVWKSVCVCMRMKDMSLSSYNLIWATLFFLCVDNLSGWFTLFIMIYIPRGVVDKKIISFEDHLLIYHVVVNWTVLVKRKKMKTFVTLDQCSNLQNYDFSSTTCFEHVDQLNGVDCWSICEN